MKTDALGTLLARTTGKPSRKWHSYIEHYDRHLGQLRHHPVRILEIGVQAGGCLETWAQYFPNSPLILGCDIDPACQNLRYDDQRIQLVIGDITQPDTVNAIKSHTSELEIILDDGSHRSEDIIKTFVTLFPLLAEDGIYIIEDLHCSYWDVYGGGLFHPGSAISFLKKIVDIINKDTWGLAIREDDFFSEFSEILADRPNSSNWQFLNWIHSIEFMNSMCVLRKKHPSRNQLGPLLVGGAMGAAHEGREADNVTAIEVPDQTMNILSKRHENAGTTDARLINAQEQIISLKAERDTLTTQFYEATKKFYDASVHIQKLEQQILALSK